MDFGEFSAISVSRTVSFGMHAKTVSRNSYSPADYSRFLPEMSAWAELPAGVGFHVGRHTWMTLTEQWIPLWNSSESICDHGSEVALPSRSGIRPSRYSKLFRASVLMKLQVKLWELWQEITVETKAKC